MKFSSSDHMMKHGASFLHCQEGRWKTEMSHITGYNHMTFPFERKGGTIPLFNSMPTTFTGTIQCSHGYFTTSERNSSSFFLLDGVYETS